MENCSAYVNGNDINVRDAAGDICNMFEDLLDKYCIDIPDEDRDLEIEDNQSRLYGMNYATCEDAISELLTDLVKSIPKNPNIVDNYNGTMGSMRDYYYRFK